MDGGGHGVESLGQLAQFVLPDDVDAVAVVPALEGEDAAVQTLDGPDQDRLRK